MGQSRGRRRDEELVSRRREQLLAAATTVFAKRGYPEAEVQEVAETCGLAKGTIYCYFLGKEQLFLAAVDRVMLDLREAINLSIATIVDPLERITAAVVAFLRYFRDHPERAELLIIERAEFRERKTPTYLEHRKVNSVQWRCVYEQLIRDGRIRPIPVDRILTVVGDLLYGTMFTNHFSGQHRSVEDQAHDVLDILFHGLLTPVEANRQNRSRSRVI